MRDRREIALTVAGLLVSAHYVYFTVTISRATHCQASYNRAFATQVYLRSQITTQADAAVDALISGFALATTANPPLTPKAAQVQTRKLFLAYRDARAAVTAAREANPLPVPPECG